MKARNELTQQEQKAQAKRQKMKNEISRKENKKKSAATSPYLLSLYLSPPPGLRLLKCETKRRRTKSNND